jgi:hypothetical protein
MRWDNPSQLPVGKQLLPAGEGCTERSASRMRGLLRSWQLAASAFGWVIFRRTKRCSLSLIRCVHAFPLSRLRYRDWRFISVAHEKGNLNDVHANFRQRRSNYFLSGRKASVPGLHNHRPARLELRAVGGKQESIRPSESFVAGPLRTEFCLWLRTQGNTR